MAVLSKKKYYKKWDEFIELEKRKRFNDSFVDQKELEKEKEELLEQIIHLERECYLVRRAELAAKGSDRFNLYTYKKAKENEEKLHFLAVKLKNNPENITKRDYENTYARATNKYLVDVLIKLVLLFLILLFFQITKII